LDTIPLDTIPLDTIPLDTIPYLPEAVRKVLAKPDGQVVTFVGYVAELTGSIRGTNQVRSGQEDRPDLADSTAGVLLFADTATAHSVEIPMSAIIHYVSGRERPWDGGRTMVYVEADTEVVWTGTAGQLVDNQNPILTFGWDDGNDNDAAGN
jgi:hypothetical protein